MTGLEFGLFNSSHRLYHRHIIISYYMPMVCTFEFRQGGFGKIVIVIGAKLP